MVSPLTSPVPVISTVPPFVAVPFCASPVGANASASTANGCDAGIVGCDELVSIAVNVCFPSVKSAVVVMSKVSPEPTVPVPTIVVVLPSA